MEAGDVATWVGSAAAVVAALASLAVWWRDRATVTWAFDREKHERSFVRNAGGAVAKDVHVRVGSASDDTDIDEQATVAAVAPGEVVPILAEANYGSPGDYALVVTWRGRFGRRERWTRILI
ncbi:hypothetical protein ACGFZG_24970 [Streptomyces antibioticus]|uniref:hypothetical protein n=1 Tax=Streptomyces antibioticus TaxID=1890 RepID=UPI0037189493